MEFLKKFCLEILLKEMSLLLSLTTPPPLHPSIHLFFHPSMLIQFLIKKNSICNESSLINSFPNWDVLFFPSMLIMFLIKTILFAMNLL